MCSNRIRAVLGKPVWLTVRAIDASETRSRRSGWRLKGAFRNASLGHIGGSFKFKSGYAKTPEVEFRPQGRVCGRRTALRTRKGPHSTQPKPHSPKKTPLSLQTPQESTCTLQPKTSPTHGGDGSKAAAHGPTPAHHSRRRRPPLRAAHAFLCHVQAALGREVEHSHYWKP